VIYLAAAIALNNIRFAAQIRGPRATEGLTMPRWTSEDIPWSSFDPSKLNQDMLKLVKAAALTEYNADHYTRYLKTIFSDDPLFEQFVVEWREEEQQHGRLLGRYATMADTNYDFESIFARFKAGYVIPVDVQTSVRGSRVGELLARCVVETGTSSFYTAMSEATEEPVLKELAKRIAADELRHYRNFLDATKRYQPIERISLLRRVLVAVGRLREANDDELAFAFHCGNEIDTPYDLQRCNQAYGNRAFKLYRPHHAERMAGMIFKAIGLNPQSWLCRQVASLAWAWLQKRGQRAAA
jgi:hypothetical protein